MLPLRQQTIVLMCDRSVSEGCEDYVNGSCIVVSCCALEKRCGDVAELTVDFDYRERSCHVMDAGVQMIEASTSLLTHCYRQHRKHTVATSGIPMQYCLRLAKSRFMLLTMTRALSNTTRCCIY